jgi:hypothetical protein
MPKGVTYTPDQYRELIRKHPHLAPDHAGAPPFALAPRQQASEPPPAVQQPKRGKRRKEMNRTEAEFARILEREKQAGEIIHYGYEEVTLRWGEVEIIKYTPDFHVISRTGKTFFIEIKGGHIWKADNLKFKVARNVFNHYEFRLWQKSKGQWERLY